MKRFVLLLQKIDIALMVLFGFFWTFGVGTGYIPWTRIAVGCLAGLVVVMTIQFFLPEVE